MESSASTQDQLTQIQRGLTPEPRRRLQNGIPQIMASQASETAAANLSEYHTVPRAVKFSTYYQEPSTYDCRCSCHRPHRFRSPQFLDQLLGSFFLGYVGLPMISVSCDTFECNHQPSPTLWIDYYFPGWFLDWRVHFLIRNRRGFGPEQSLRVTRVVAPTADPIKAAMQGDVERMRSLLRDGHASPYDTDGINSPLIVRKHLYPWSKLANQCLSTSLPFRVSTWRFARFCSTLALIPTRRLVYKGQHHSSR